MIFKVKEIWNDKCCDKVHLSLQEAKDNLPFFSTTLSLEQAEMVTEAAAQIRHSQELKLLEKNKEITENPFAPILKKTTLNEVEEGRVFRYRREFFKRISSPDERAPDIIICSRVTKEEENLNKCLFFENLEVEILT